MSPAITVAELIPTSGGPGVNQPPGWMVFGFEVVPYSFQHDTESIQNIKTYDKYPTKIQYDPTTFAMLVKKGQPIIYTYEYSFVETNIKWPSRWDTYLKMEGAKVHWFSILNSLMVIAFLAGIVLVIFLRMVRRDLTRYKELEKEAQAQMNEELSGWKLVVADVFRAPTKPTLLCILVGERRAPAVTTEDEAPPCRFDRWTRGNPYSLEPRVVLCSCPDWIVIGESAEDYVYSSYYGASSDGIEYISEDVIASGDIT